MNNLFRQAALLVLGILLAMPVITLHGSIHLLMLIVCVVVLGRQMLEPGIWQLTTLSVYALLIGAFYVKGFDDWKEINSQQMRQVSMMLFVFCAMRRSTLREMHAFFAFVLLIAVAGVAGEMRGMNMHDYLPAKLAEQDYYNDAAFLASGEQRFRGFFSESSVLLAATTGYGFMAILGMFVAWRYVRGRVFLTISVMFCSLAIIFLLAVTLAKTGLLLAFGAVAGFVFAVMRYAPRRLPILVAGMFALALLAGAGFMALPSAKRDYFINELAALRPALEGNSKLESTSSGGLLTRVECWRIAVQSAREHPLGVGLYGIEQVASDNNHISLTGELKYLFSLGIFGLKNTLANVLAQTGLPGMALLLAGLWQLFIRPIRLARRLGEPFGADLAGIYFAALSIAFFFLATCETYYWLAFVMIMKCYADAVARACGFLAPGELEADLDDMGEFEDTPQCNEAAIV